MVHSHVPDHAERHESGGPRADASGAASKGGRDGARRGPARTEGDGRTFRGGHAVARPFRAAGAPATRSRIECYPAPPTTSVGGAADRNSAGASTRGAEEEEP